MEQNEMIEMMFDQIRIILTEDGKLEETLLTTSRMVAKLQGAYYKELLEQDFTEEQALTLLYDVNEVLKAHARRN